MEERGIENAWKGGLGLGHCHVGFLGIRTLLLFCAGSGVREKYVRVSQELKNNGTYLYNTHVASS